MTALVVAGVSARAMAESARRAGFDAIALDCFGDADTRRASRRWEGIADANAPFEIDAGRFVAALEAAAAEPDVRAWIPGAGFEARPDLLERGARVLRMAGTAAEDVRRLRDPRDFFARLDAAGIAHPAVRFDAVVEPAGWLLKDAGGRGGWHVRPAAALDGAPPPGSYLQREVDGVPMSATFLADGSAAHLLGINRQRVRRFGTRAHVFRGVVGPVGVPSRVAQRVVAALRRLVPAYRLRGLGSLDFVLDGHEPQVLEVNPRPPASLALYETDDGLIAPHVAACLEGRLPPAWAPDHGTVRGIEIVYARGPIVVSERAAQQLVHAGCHDRPLVGSRFAAGDPVCSVGAEGPDADAVEARLDAARDELLSLLETPA